MTIDPDPQRPRDVAKRLAAVRAEKVAEAGVTGSDRKLGLGGRWRKAIPED